MYDQVCSKITFEIQCIAFFNSVTSLSSCYTSYQMMRMLHQAGTAMTIAVAASAAVAIKMRKHELAKHRLVAAALLATAGQIVALQGQLLQAAILLQIPVTVGRRAAKGRALAQRVEQKASRGRR
jgi:hypothetical protein